jgi:peptidoglycan/xylan/chitin deacetylase (PgdA/CDA1 family)
MRSIALTFDDAPREDTVRFTGAERGAELLARLREAGVPRAAIFVNSFRMDEEGRRRIEAYAAAGHTIANHSHSHLDIDATDAAAYVADIAAAHDRLAELPTYLRWFRYPFLREGADRSKRDHARRELSRLGYRNGYVTVNTFDWHMDTLLQQAFRSGRSVDYDRLRQVYLEVLLGCVEFTDTLAQKVLGRSPRHVLLLHENDLNALFARDLVVALRESGWTIIAPETAFEDEIASMETDTIFPGNPGRIGEIAYDRGVRGPLNHESCNMQYLERLFEERKVFSSPSSN